ncbi:MAG: DUF1800 domain-containing protein [Bacteroidetes bacterium]|nr:DUF1800 domain-containing protein [Bacteroidota bacterium]
MQRRDLFRPKTAALDAVQAEYANRTLPSGLERSSAGLEPYAGPWGDEQMLHLLRRTTFGVNLTDLALVRTKTLAETVAQLLVVPPLPAPPVNNYSSTADPTGVFPGATWVTAAYNSTVNGSRTASWKAWWFNEMITLPLSLREKMTLFWHNHFATETPIIDNSRDIYNHHALLRQFALGNFKELTRRVTLDPGMLRYLNGNANTKSAPDENYARELQELFTIGKGPDSRYTEEDVKNAARVLTGWRINGTTYTSYFDSTRHDTGNKSFSSFYGSKVITGRSGATAGELELNDLLDMLFANDETAKFLARKLYRFFVYYIIDAAVEQNVITPLAQVIRQNNYEITPALSVLFNSAHFFDPLNMGCVIKTPLDVTVGLCREFGINAVSTAVPPAALTDAQRYGIWDHLRTQSSAMQMHIGEPPNVAGWPAYYQEPQFYEIWINADTLPKRNQFTDTMVTTSGYTRSSTRLVVDVIAYAKRFPAPADPTALVNDIVRHLYAIPVSETLKTSLKTGSLLSGQASDHYWTDAWNAYIANPSDTQAKNAVITRLQALLKALMNAAEYQLA